MQLGSLQIDQCPGRTTFSLRGTRKLHHFCHRSEMLRIRKREKLTFSNWWTSQQTKRVGGCIAKKFVARNCLGARTFLANVLFFFRGSRSSSRHDRSANLSYCWRERCNNWKKLGYYSKANNNQHKPPTKTQNRSTQVARWKKEVKRCYLPPYTQPFFSMNHYPLSKSPFEPFSSAYVQNKLWGVKLLTHEARDNSVLVPKWHLHVV